MHAYPRKVYGMDQYDPGSVGVSDWTHPLPAPKLISSIYSNWSHLHPICVSDHSVRWSPLLATRKEQPTCYGSYGSVHHVNRTTMDRMGTYPLARRWLIYNIIAIPFLSTYILNVKWIHCSDIKMNKYLMNWQSCSRQHSSRSTKIRE